MARLLVAGLFLLLLWYLLRLLTRAGLIAWRFLLGFAGLFCFLMWLANPLLTSAYNQSVCTLLGLLGGLTHTFSAYVQYGLLFIPTNSGSLILGIGTACFGLIGIMGYLSLIALYTVYNGLERCILALTGAAYILVSDVFQLAFAAEMTHFLNIAADELAGTVFRSFVFGLFHLVLYYFVFTKGQVMRIKIGNFSYAQKGAANTDALPRQSQPQRAAYKHRETELAASGSYSSDP